MTSELAQDSDEVVEAGSFVPSPVVDSLEGSVPDALTVRGRTGSSSQSIVTYMPEDLPQRLQELMRSTGMSSRMVHGGRLLMNGAVVPRWSMDFSVELSDEEGEAIFGMLVSNSPDNNSQFFQVL